MSRLTRREFLARSVTAAAAIGAAPLIVSCTSGGRTTPDSVGPLPPVGREPIAGGLPPESGPLILFNWEQYLWKAALEDFAGIERTDWRYITFFNSDEAIERMADEAFDVAVIPMERVPALIERGLIQPVNKEYLTNLENVWPEALTRLGLDPEYGTPYTVAKAGIGWWPDRIGSLDPRDLRDPLDAFWVENLRGAASLPDNYRVGVSLGQLHAGLDDLDSGDPAVIDRAKQGLLASGARIELQDPAMWLAWSGDSLPPTDPSTGTGPRFMFGGRPLLVADAFVIPSDAQHPVLAHRFIDFMLRPDVATQNSMWLDYRQPVETPFSYGWPARKDGLVTRRDLERGYPLGPLDAGADALWRAAWDEVRQALA